MSSDDAAALNAAPLDFVERRRRPADDRYRWTPFAIDDRFTSHWWDDPPYLYDDPWFIEIRSSGIEVARVELDEDFRGSAHAGAPKLGSVALEVQFIEVAHGHRGRGIGTAVIRRLMREHPRRRLLALSEEADEFWASLGWERFDHRSGPHRYRPLFVQPANRR